ncbi:hypothetical protein ACIOC2_01280 [Streptomyces sp. NPDC088337]|uniref:hypothetical protein n=1 Tax=unclassified Streptomyces TaxID=2593676 RepID=UPI003806AA38
MPSRTDIVADVLRSPVLHRPVLAHEMREHLVQGIDPRSAQTRWTATVPQLAEAIDTALREADREEKDIPADTNARHTGTTFTARADASTGHALILEAAGPDFIGTCQCGRRIGRTPQNKPVDALVGLWERHTSSTSQDEAWADAVASLPFPPARPPHEGPHSCVAIPG